MDVIEDYNFIIKINTQVIQMDVFFKKVNFKSRPLNHSGLSPWLYSLPGRNTDHVKAIVSL